MLKVTDGERFATALTNDARKSDILAAANSLIADRPVANSIADDGVLLGLAKQLAASRREALAIESPLRVAMVFAMWREAKRLQPQSADNPNGEDCLRHKLASLEWLFRDTKVDWHLYAVDDDCPEGSGQIARAVADASRCSKRVTVRHLRDGYPYASPPLSALMSPADSSKGGAVVLGLSSAIADGY